MAFKIPTTATSVAQVLTSIEKRINQNTPLALKSFNRVLSVAFGFVITGLYKYASVQAKENLVLTASAIGLKRLGEDRGVFRKQAQSAVLSAQMTALDGTIIPITASFIAEQNGIRYFNNASETASAGLATLEITAQETGAITNLEVGSILNIGSQIAGADSVLTVINTITNGVDQEDIEVYRSRVLTAYRAKTGGSNTADYRIWAEEVEGVKAGFPYSGGPINEVVPKPGERTVYVEATPEINPDGIAPQSLLDAVEANIIADATTGIYNQTLGMTNDTLYVRSIIRTPIFVEIVDLVVDPSVLTQAQSDIQSALDLYFESVKMFVYGLDFIDDKNDTITIASISGVVTDALQATGGNVSSVRFGLDASVIATRYILVPGQLVKTGSINYVSN